jgi:hypothetical protein
LSVKPPTLRPWDCIAPTSSFHPPFPTPLSETQLDDLIVSKIDEADGHDDIERVGRLTRMPICAATNGQNIVEDILPGAMSSGYAGDRHDSFEEDR